MRLTPSQAFEHIKESVVEYLETAYKISHPAIIAERGEILRRRGTVAQVPFIESTPAFPAARKLAELERAYPDKVPIGLAELVKHGVPVDRFPLYTHQEEALLAATADRHNLLVATGTGSGKTESFLLPILADILREAYSWSAPIGPARRGQYDESTGLWLHSRRHETRPAALRGMILYPMNALVNDQLSRLRRILARGDSPEWQRANLNGNVIHFGMYTGLSQPAGPYKDKWRRDNYAAYLAGLEGDWQKLRGELRETGNWPRPDSPEMLCRWDMQAVPPDLVVTNYSMLEYMLVRPIEYQIFESTKAWLRSTPSARFTLVLDEAHTYTGAKGTEVAYLIRRLKERLGLDAGSPQFRTIATSASIPNVPGSDHELLEFVSNLCGEPANRFTLIRTGNETRSTPNSAGDDAPSPSRQGSAAPRRAPDSKAFHAFRRFHDAFDIEDPFPAIAQIAEDLDLGLINRTVDPQVALYELLERNEDVLWVRQRTARNATLIDQLADECWGTLGTHDERERAVSGVLAAGSFSRASALPDTPPLLSMRVHSFFRGIPGIWACMDPQCSAVAQDDASVSLRPVGKLYVEPRPWCECGARVLELFSCRRCGLLFLGGIPDTAEESLWPWSDDLSGDRADVRAFRIFGVDSPGDGATAEYRSTRTTLNTHPNDVFARSVYPVKPAAEGNGQNGDGKQISPFPTQCPRCQNYRAPGPDGREVIEPLRTKGPQSFSIAAEDGFRVQPRTPRANPPNHGRKALLFTDSRMEAAQLAGDMRKYHHDDLFRQLVFRVLHSCSVCEGTGKYLESGDFVIGQEESDPREVACGVCRGTGRISQPTPLEFDELRTRVIKLQLSTGVDPTNGEGEDGKYFTHLEHGVAATDTDAKLAFHLNLRRELAQTEFALEPLGLASWHIKLPAKTGVFPQLSEEETHVFLRSVARILATENILLPPNPQNPWDWPDSLVKDYERQVIIPGNSVQGRAVPYNLKHYRKLGRYVIALSRALVRDGRLKDAAAADQWVKDLHWPLWKALTGFGALQWAGAKINDQVPHGIRIDSFTLYPIGDQVEQCQACAYVMSETVLKVCTRCGQSTQAIPASSLVNFYRRAAIYALPGSGYDDPYPLRAIEHTGQISGAEARNEERWFQDLFHDDQNALDHRIDILSVTTTMEMGIDIGSLLSVGLRNVPPSVANYQQRAGRAGRRGSSIATVLTFAQFRSHDQYYFDHPPEIVSEPPRVPALYLHNEVILRRHVRSVVLQVFFHALLSGEQTRGLFGAWGTVADFVNRQAGVRLTTYVQEHLPEFNVRCRLIAPAALWSALPAWINAVPKETLRVIEDANDKDEVLEKLISVGLLPKYAFPVDVVGLSIPNFSTEEWSEGLDNDVMQRDLKIALSEYAPGSEVIKGNFPNTYIYRSVGVYDPFNKTPDYSPTGIMVECQTCQSVAVVEAGKVAPDVCEECGSPHTMPLAYLRPRGFTVDSALPDAGRELYKGGGRERAGYTPPARLLVGQTSFATGIPQSPFAPRLYEHVRSGDLFACNKGPDHDFPGFLICPTCGRALDPDNLGPHRYPADMPPLKGRTRGPRAGQMCPNRTDFKNSVILGYEFHSEVILLGVDLPEALDAPFMEPSGKAVWYSFGTLLSNAASLVLQIDPGELKVGARAVRRGPGRLHAEVFLYDDVPGGAGYAHAIEHNLEDILRKALALGKRCSNPDCGGACYHCMYDYRNQGLHPLLERELGAALLRYILNGDLPLLTRQRMDQCAVSLAEFARANWEIDGAATVNGHYFPCVLRDKSGQRVGLWVIHPLQARPTPEERQAILTKSGMRCAPHTSFDLEHRPFWVLNHLVMP